MPPRRYEISKFRRVYQLKNTYYGIEGAYYNEKFLKIQNLRFLQEDGKMADNSPWIGRRSWRTTRG